MTSAGLRQKLAWELVGILAVGTIFLVMGLIWLGARLGGPGPARPEISTSDQTLGLPEGRDADGRPFLGLEAATHRLHIFGDFQCARTKRFSQQAVDLYREYVPAGRLAVVWVNLPQLGAESRAAARAAVCAAKQGKFWPLHDYLFANQPDVPESGAFSERKLLAMAKAAGLNAAELKTCLADEATEKAVADDEALAAERKVTTTPTLLLDDELIPNADLELLRQRLERPPATATE